jgi:hypothetical protein
MMVTIRTNNQSGLFVYLFRHVLYAWIHPSINYCIFICSISRTMPKNTGDAAPPALLSVAVFVFLLIL